MSSEKPLLTPEYLDAHINGPNIATAFGKFGRYVARFALIEAKKKVASKAADKVDVTITFSVTPVPESESMFRLACCQVSANGGPPADPDESPSVHQPC